jgi:hypothetical protein
MHVGDTTAANRKTLDFSTRFGVFGIQPGTAPGSPGDYWTTPALVPDIFKLSTEIVWELQAPGPLLEPRATV